MSARAYDAALAGRGALWMLAFVVFLSFFWQLGAVPLYDLDEGAFTEATREMLASGNFITPRKDGEPRYDKPVLIYWLQAASATLLGFDEAALRLPSAIAATLWLAALWGFVRERLDAQSAGVAALMMALSLEISLIAKAAVADAVLNLFIALAFFDIYRYRLEPSRGRLLRVYLWLGLGFLTKGPVAVFFPLLVSFLYFLSLKDLKRWWGAIMAPLGWLVFLAVALPWYVAIYIDNGSGFFESFFLDHNLGRFQGAKHGHSGFFGYYFVMLPLIMLPFTGLLLRLLPLARQLWDDPLDRFLMLWFAVVFLFFSFSGTKLPHYLVYGITPLFVLMARHRQVPLGSWLAFTPPMILLLLLAVLPEALPLIAAQADRPHEQAMFAEAGQVLDARYRIAAWLAVAAVLALALWRGAAAWRRLLLVGVVQLVLVFGSVVPAVFQVLQDPVKQAGLLARELGEPTVVYSTSMPSFSVYRGDITPEIKPDGRQLRHGDLVFLRVDKIERLERSYPNFRQELVYRRGPVALIRALETKHDG